MSIGLPSLCQCQLTSTNKFTMGRRQQQLSRPSRQKSAVFSSWIFAYISLLLVSCSWLVQVQAFTPQCPHSLSSYRHHAISPNNNDDDNKEQNNNNDDVGVDDETDYTSFQNVPWHELDPLNHLSFDDYESMYLLKEKSTVEAVADDSSTDSFVSKEKHPNCDSSRESVMTEWLDSVPTLNHISVVGRVGKNPEATYFDNPNNSKPNVVVKMSLALPRYYSAWEREQEGIKYGEEQTEWYNLECWGYIGEFALKFVEKGTRIGVIGSIDTDCYRSKQNGRLRTAGKIIVKDLDILESKMESDARRMRNNNGGDRQNYNNNRQNYNNNQQQQQNQRSSFNAQSNNGYYDDDDDDDDDTYDPKKGGSGTAGGFFDPM